MKIICPEHGGVLRLPIIYFNKRNVHLNNLVVECPVCDDEVLIDGFFDFDAKGMGSKAKPDWANQYQSHSL